MLTFQNSTSPSWMLATLTRPPALGSCSGAQRTQRLNPTSTAPMTPSSSRYALSSLPSSHPVRPLCPQNPGSALLCPLLHLLMPGSPLTHQSCWAPVSCAGLAPDLAQLTRLTWPFAVSPPGSKGEMNCSLGLPSRTKPLCVPQRSRSSVPYIISSNPRPHPARQAPVFSHFTDKENEAWKS